MSNWLQRLKNRFTRAAAPPSPADAARLTRLKQLVLLDDPVETEAARDIVQPNDVLPLLTHYQTLTDWDQKRVIVELLQDQFHPEMKSVMLDYLRAPMGPGDEWTELAKAVALSFIDEQYDQFMTYYNDRARLRVDVAAVLAAHNLSETAPPAPAPPAPTPVVDRRASPGQRLIDGATIGEMTAVQQALLDGADINVTIHGGDYDGCSALIMALMRKRFTVADYLIDMGADVNQKRPARHTPDRTRGQTPLWWAANHNQLQLARKLLDHGAQINTPDHHGGTPLTVAAGSGHLEMVQFLVENGADLHAQIYDGRKAFNLAVTNGRKKVAEYLLSRGNNPNERGNSGYTPLMICAADNFYDLAKSLIAQGADVNAVHTGSGIYAGLRGWTPLVFAVRNGYVRMSKLLLAHGANVNHQVEAGVDGRGEPTPVRRVIDFAQGKRAKRMRELLQEAGAR